LWARQQHAQYSLSTHPCKLTLPKVELQQPHPCELPLLHVSCQQPHQLKSKAAAAAAAAAM